MKSTQKINVHAQSKDSTPGTQRNLYSTGLRLGFVSGKTQLLGFASGKTRKICVIQHRRYQHVGILASGEAKVSSFASGNAKVPNASSFASQWNIGFTVLKQVII